MDASPLLKPLFRVSKKLGSRRKESRVCTALSQVPHIRMNRTQQLKTRCKMSINKALGRQLQRRTLAWKISFSMLQQELIPNGHIVQQILTGL